MAMAATVALGGRRPDGTRCAAGNVLVWSGEDDYTDTRTLQEAIEQVGSVSLIIIDPLSTAVSGDIHKNTAVRRGLQPLVDLATNINAALLGITHLSKGGQGSDPAWRVIGSIAFTAVARVVLACAGGGRTAVSAPL